MEPGNFDHIHKFSLDLDEECLHILQQYFIDSNEPLTHGCMKEWRDFIYKTVSCARARNDGFQPTTWREGVWVIWGFTSLFCTG